MTAHTFRSERNPSTDLSTSADDGLAVLHIDQVLLASASPRIGDAALTAQSVALIVQARAQAAGFGSQDLGGHSLKPGTLTANMEKQTQPTRLKRLSRHKSYCPLGE